MVTDKNEDPKNQEPLVVLNWNYEPPDYYEQTIEIQLDNYFLKIENGKAVAKINASVFDNTPDLQVTLHENLRSRFLAVQVLTHQAYKLSKPTMLRIDADGRKHQYVSLGLVIEKTVIGKLDLVIKERDGNIIADTKKERIESHENFANFVSIHRANDKFLDAMLNSYENAVQDPNNELIHLYEVIDTLKDKFGKEENVRKVLDLSKSSLTRLHKLANFEPLKQGRHRGKNAGKLRDASQTELDEARAIASLIISKYVDWLRNNA